MLQAIAEKVGAEFEPDEDVTVLAQDTELEKVVAQIEEHVKAVEERRETGFRRERHWWWNEMIAEATRECHARQHRVGRADGWVQRRAGGVGVG